MRENLSSKRAKFAFEKVKEIKKNKDEFDKYLSIVRAFPSMILRNGYGPAMAFLYSKSTTDYKELYLHISSWLTKQHLIKNNTSDNFNPDILMDSITQDNQNKYKLLKVETMALLEWLKRFAEGMSSSE